MRPRNVPLFDLGRCYRGEIRKFAALDVRQITARTCDICGGVDIRNLMASIAQVNITLSRRIQDAVQRVAVAN